MGARRDWTRSELLLALHLYDRIPFGQQHSRNAQVMALAARIGRTPGSVAMKLNNLTALDPSEKGRVKGLSGASSRDRSTWAEFHNDPLVVLEAEALWEGESEEGAREVSVRGWSGETEKLALRRQRLAQNFFRLAVLDNFGGRCALTGMAVPELLTASHIVGWAESPEHRVRASNGLCLNKLHDAAFDRKLITLDEDLRLVVGRRLADGLTKEGFEKDFLSFEGTPIAAPARHDIDRALVARHREAFLRAEAA